MQSRKPLASRGGGEREMVGADARLTQAATLLTKAWVAEASAVHTLAVATTVVQTFDLLHHLRLLYLGITRNPTPA
jgi:hypothetical protein